MNTRQDGRGPVPEPEAAPVIKICPSCGRNFECRSQDPGRCDCARVALTPETLAALRGRFRDCLCLTCLTRLADGEYLAGQGAGRR